MNEGPTLTKTTSKEQAMYNVKTRTVMTLLSWFVLTALILTTATITSARNACEPKPSDGGGWRAAETGYQPDNTASTKKAIVGSWIETVTFSGPGSPPPLKSLVKFSADGTMTVADQGNVNTSAGTVFSAGHGSWVAVGERTFSWTIVELISDLSGNLLGTLKVRGTYTVDETGNAYAGVFKAEVNIFGDTFSFEGSNEGTRIQVEPLE
jgi:hypothetical protein